LGQRYKRHITTKPMKNSWTCSTTDSSPSSNVWHYYTRHNIPCKERVSNRCERL